MTDEEYNNIASRDRRSPPPKSPNASVSSAVTYQAVPNTDELPTAFGALEGIYNDLTSQLQKLAGRVDTVNEWIDLDRIVLARFRSYDLAAKGHEVKSIDDLHRDHYPDGNNIAWSCRVLEMTERIEGMRRWRKELERSVCWLRAEYWRVETAMGRKPAETAGRSEANDLGKWTGSR